MLAKKRVVMNWYSFLGHEYSFFNAIVSRLIALTLIWGGGINLPLSKTHQNYARNLKFGT